MADTRASMPTTHIEIVEPDPDECTHSSLPPEGNVKHRNYRVLSENIRAYTPTGDINTSPTKGKLVSKFDVANSISCPRQKILELLRPEDPGREALEAIVKPASRRGLTRPFDDDTRRFLQRALLSPSPQGFSNVNTPEPHRDSPDHTDRVPPTFDKFLTVNTCHEHERLKAPDDNMVLSPEQDHTECDKEVLQIVITDENNQRHRLSETRNKQLSLADELREAEQEGLSGSYMKRDLLHSQSGGLKESFERERLAKLALSVEEDEEESECDSLTLAARRLDALLAESRGLHAELAGIQQDMQAACVRASRCCAAARALEAESRALYYLDDVVSLLRGDVGAARRARDWPFAQGRRDEDRNYVV